MAKIKAAFSRFMEAERREMKLPDIIGIAAAEIFFAGVIFWLLNAF